MAGERVAWPMRALPAVYVAGRFPLDDQGFSYRYLGKRHALHLYDYHGRIRIGRREVALRPGDVTLTPAGVPTWYDVTAPGHHLCIHFEAMKTGGRDAVRLPLHQSLGWQRGYAAERLLAVARWHAASERDRSAWAAASAALQELLLWLAQAARRPAKDVLAWRAGRAVEQAASLIEEQLGRAICVPQLAKTVGMSQNYLARCFRRRFGVPIPRYILARRIDLARHLLATTDLPVRRVAERVGLPDPQHFNKQFRKLAGVNPTAARLHAVQPGV